MRLRDAGAPLRRRVRSATEPPALIHKERLPGFQLCPVDDCHPQHPPLPNIQKADARQLAVMSMIQDASKEDSVEVGVGGLSAELNAELDGGPRIGETRKIKQTLLLRKVKSSPDKCLNWRS